MDGLNILILLSILTLTSCSASEPRIKCFDPNNYSADTSYFVKSNKYSGFVFTKDYDPMLKVSGIRFTPTLEEIKLAEDILKSKVQYSRAHKRQYIGHVNESGDSLVFIRLMKNGFKEECFDKIVAVGFGDHYEKNQRIHDINLTRKKIM